MALITVVIPVYNSAHLLKKALNSLLKQTMSDFVVNICDDGSTDDIKEVVGYFNDKLNISYFYIPNSGGPAKPRNIAIENSTSRYIAFLDADDTWYDEKLELCLAQLECGYDFVYHNMCIKTVDSAGNTTKKSEKKPRALAKEDVFDELLFRGNVITNSSVMTRRELLVQVGLFNESSDLVAAEDYIMWLGIAKLTDKFVKIDRVLGEYTIHDSNISHPDKTIKYINRITVLFGKYINKNFVCYPIWFDRSLAKANFLKAKLFLAFAYLGRYLFKAIFFYFFRYKKNNF